jgi:hypothetical protein
VYKNEKPNGQPPIISFQMTCPRHRVYTSMINQLRNAPTAMIALPSPPKFLNAFTEERLFQTANNQRARLRSSNRTFAVEAG